MLELYYSDPKDVENGKDMYAITDFVMEAVWSGDREQAARKLSFTIAYNTSDKDLTFPAIDMKMGGIISVFYSDDVQPRVQIFTGHIFYRHRNTEQYSFEYTAYDDMIYLAKSKIYKVLDNVSVTEAIRQISGELGLETSDMPTISTKVNFLADGKSCTEVFKELERQSLADTGKDFSVVCLLGKITLIQKGEAITDYIAIDDRDLFHTEHSESIEDMVNRVAAVDETGHICQIFSNEEDITKYGIIQNIYRMQPDKSGTVDNTKAAKAMLKRLQEHSSLEGIGNIQCITGYAVMLQEEQLKGKFFIQSDTHTFKNGQHTMSLTLEYMEE